MRREHHDTLATLAKGAHDVFQAPRRLGVEAGERLIEQHDLGFVQKRARKGRSLPETLAQDAHRLIETLRNTERIRQKIHARRYFCALHAKEPGVIAEVFSYRQARI